MRGLRSRDLRLCTPTVGVVTEGDVMASCASTQGSQEQAFGTALIAVPCAEARHPPLSRYASYKTVEDRYGPYTTVRGINSGDNDNAESALHPR
jgi:hypothetical protein